MHLTAERKGPGSREKFPSLSCGPEVARDKGLARVLGRGLHFRCPPRNVQTEAQSPAPGCRKQHAPPHLWKPPLPPAQAELKKENAPGREGPASPRLGAVPEL